MTVKLSEQKSLIPELERLKNDNSSLKSRLIEAASYRTQVMELNEKIESQEEQIHRWKSRTEALQSENEFMRKQKNEILTSNSQSKEKSEKMMISLVDEYKKVNTNLTIRIQELESLLIQNENKRLELRKKVERHATEEFEK